MPGLDVIAFEGQGAIGVEHLQDFVSETGEEAQATLPLTYDFCCEALAETDGFCRSLRPCESVLRLEAANAVLREHNVARPPHLEVPGLLP